MPPASPEMLIPRNSSVASKIGRPTPHLMVEWQAQRESLSWGLMLRCAVVRPAPPLAFVDMTRQEQKGHSALSGFFLVGGPALVLNAVL